LEAVNQPYQIVDKFFLKVISSEESFTPILARKIDTGKSQKG